MVSIAPFQTLRFFFWQKTILRDALRFVILYFFMKQALPPAHYGRVLQSVSTISQLSSIFHTHMHVLLVSDYG